MARKAIAQGGNARRESKREKPLKREEREIQELEARIQAGAPRPGSNPLSEALLENVVEDPETGYKPYVGAKRFDQLPISERTLNGLRGAKYITMTEIQRAALPHALAGRDVLGAAKTGSGKTLAFLIPVLEHLYRVRWGNLDGIGALVISPTRELAVQIFEQLKKVGQYHNFSGALLIGGRKDIDKEKARVNGMNILVCTPGRLLQHMDETVNFDCSQLQVLVLDEADQILDMGFANTINNILAQIPKERQTFLFSATQTRSVQDLARLSLKDPEYLAVHAESPAATPKNLREIVMTVPLDRKLDTLWSFIRKHLHAKMLVFFSTCKQVKFVHEAFRKLRPGVPLACLHGRMKQAARLEVFLDFAKKKYAVLFATDIAARGLDFSAIDWVVQVDCPEDAKTYIHRVGRTARLTSKGCAVLFLAPSEEKMLGVLAASKVPIGKEKPLQANPKKMETILPKLASLLSQDPELKYTAQRAFITYLRSVHVHADKEIFDVQKLPVAEFAASLGLPSTPRVRFLKKGQSHMQKNVSYTQNSENEEKDGSADVEEKQQTEEADDAPFFRTKGLRVDTVKETADVSSENVSVFKKKKLKISLAKPQAKRLVFDEDGNAIPPLLALAKESGEQQKEADAKPNDDVTSAVAERFKDIQQKMKERDKEDKLLEKQRLRNNRLKRKQKLQEVEASEDEKSVEPSDGGQSEYSSGEDDDTEESRALQVDSLSLADQEALAAKLLRSRA